MKKLDTRLLWGLLLVAGGLLLLLQNLGYIPMNNLFGAVVLGGAGLVFLFVLVNNRQNWWAIIPGLILSYLALLIVMDEVFPSFAGNIGGPLLLAVIGVAFWIIFFLQPAYWWAIIPGGVMITLGLVAATESFFTGVETGGLFFLGLGLTFGILSMIETPTGKMKWPLIPAGILLLLGVVVSLAATSIMRFLWPVALILFGLYLFFMRKPVDRV